MSNKTPLTPEQITEIETEGLNLFPIEVDSNGVDETGFEILIDCNAKKREEWIELKIERLTNLL